MKNILRSLFLCIFFSGAANAQSLQWGTYLGGMNREYGTSICTDKWGNIYMVGNTSSTSNIATPASHQASYGGETGSTGAPGDAFIAKYNSNGLLLWATYFGGNDDDAATGIGCDTTGRLYICGWTRSSNGIATSGSHQGVYGGGDDAFLACFDTAGNRIWSTYYGGNGDENSFLNGGLFVDKAGNAYLTGKTSSSNNISTLGSHKPSLSVGATTDAYVVKFNRHGQRIWGTYFGNSLSNLEGTEGAAIYADGLSLYITGATNCLNGISTSGTHMGAFAGGTKDAFLAKFDTAGVLQWGTYFGGTATDLGTAIVTDAGHVYLSGNTNSGTGISTAGSHQTVIGGNQDLFLAQFTTNGLLNWSTYLGGTVLDAAGRSMAKDPLGNIYLTGYAASQAGIATPNAIQTIRGGGQDAIFAKFMPTGNLIWASYYGGTGVDNGLGMATNGQGIIYLSGRTASATAIATTGSQQAIFAGDNDAMLIAINDCVPILKPDTIIGSISVCKNSSLTYRGTTVPGAVSYTWLLPSGWSGASATESINAISGVSSGWIRLLANGICSNSDTQLLYVSVSPTPVINPMAPMICNGDSVRFNVTNVAGSVQWLFNNVPIIGGNTNAITARQTGTYAVVGTDGGCIDTSISASLIVHPLPTVPNIIKTGQVLSLPVAFTSYQWNFNGSPITGATGSTFTYSIDGLYTVTVSDANGCSTNSDPLNTNGSSVSSQSLASLLVYPNPLVGRQVSIRTDEACSVLVCTLDGRTVSRHLIGRGLNTIDVSGLSSGIYLMRIQDRNGSFLLQKLTLL